MQGCTVLGKRRRVEDYQVVLTACTLQIFEGILTNSLMARVVGEIQLHIAACQLYCLCRTVDTAHLNGSATHGIERESPCVAEHIEHPLALGVLFQQGTVLALVDEEAGFLSLEPVHMKAQSILYSRVVGASTINKTVFLPEVSLKRQRGLALIIYIMYVVAHHPDKRLCHLVAAHVHANAVSLHHGCIAINVYHQSGQIVALAMNKTVGVVVGVACYAYGKPHFVSRGKSRLPVIAVDGNVGKRKYPHRNGTYLIVPHSNEIVLTVNHPYHIALGYAVVHSLYGSRKHPWMKAFQAFFLSLLEIYFFITRHTP